MDQKTILTNRLKKLEKISSGVAYDAAMVVDALLKYRNDPTEIEFLVRKQLPYGASSKDHIFRGLATLTSLRLLEERGYVDFIDGLYQLTKKGVDSFSQ